MGIYLTGLSNEVVLSEEDIASYSYSEETTNIEPSELRGGAAQVTITVKSDADISVATAISFIDTALTLVDSELGSVPFQVNNVTKDYSGSLTIVGDTFANILNVEVTATPRTGTLKSAIQYYCGLAGVTPAFDSTGDAAIDSQLTSRSINFIGWKGNLWEHLKMLCAGVSASTSSHIPFEMYIKNGVLRFRKSLALTTNQLEYESNRSISIDSANLANAIEIYNYTTSYKTNGVLFEQDQGESGPTLTYPATTSPIVVNAGEKVVKVIKVGATLSSVNNPTPVNGSTISLPYSGTSGAYVVYGSNDLPITAAQWTAAGGSVTTALTENPDEVEITVTAPPKPASQAPGSDAGEGGTSNGTITALAPPTALDLIQITGNTFDLSYTAPNGAQYFIITITPNVGAVQTVSSSSLTTRISYSNSATSCTISMVAVTDAGYDAGTGESNKRLTSGTSGNLVITSAPPLEPTWTFTPSGGSGTTTSPAGPTNDVNNPDVPGVPSTDQTDPNQASTTLSFDSYKVGLEMFNGVEKPALYITGTGVWFDKQMSTVSTGLSTTNAVGVTIDNPFITTSSDVTYKGNLARDAYKYPVATMNQTVAINDSFGDLIGKTQVVDGATFRIETAAYTPTDINLTSRKV